MRTTKRFLSLCFGLLVLPGLAFGQQKARFVLDAKPFPGQPIAILSKSVGDNPLGLSSDVLADDDWIGDFRLEFQNLSTKKIVRVLVYFEVQTMVAGKLPTVFSIIYRPERDLDPAVRDGKGLSPGQISYIGVDHYPTISHALKSLYGGREVTNATISVRSVEFDDDTQWSTGFQLRRDPTNRDKWIQVGKSEQ